MGVCGRRQQDVVVVLGGGGRAENGQCCVDWAKETFAGFVLADGEVCTAFVKTKTHMDECWGLGWCV